MKGRKGRKEDITAETQKKQNNKRGLHKTGRRRGRKADEEVWKGCINNKMRGFVLKRGVSKENNRSKGIRKYEGGRKKKKNIRGGSGNMGTGFRGVINGEGRYILGKGALFPLGGGGGKT